MPATRPPLPLKTGRRTRSGFTEPDLARRRSWSPSSIRRVRVVRCWAASTLASARSWSLRSKVVFTPSSYRFLYRRRKREPGATHPACFPRKPRREPVVERLPYRRITVQSPPRRQPLLRSLRDRRQFASSTKPHPFTPQGSPAIRDLFHASPFPPFGMAGHRSDCLRVRDLKRFRDHPPTGFHARTPVLHRGSCL